MKNIGSFLRNFNLRAQNIKLENLIVQERLKSQDSPFSLKSFLIQLTLGIIGLVMMIYISPLLGSNGEKSITSGALVSLVLGGILMAIGAMAIIDLLKYILKIITAWIGGYHEKHR